MTEFSASDDSLERAQEMDRLDPLRDLRAEFAFPHFNDRPALYFAGHSLGLMPLAARELVGQELDDWQRLGVEGHFKAKGPWLSYHETATSSFAHLVGAQTREVVAMNTLTVNLHLMLVSFYRPNKKRFKILIENNTFPSDKYAVDSQARFHGYDPAEAVVCLRPGEDGMTVSRESVLAQMEEIGDELALVMLGQCNYLSGQAFCVSEIAEKAREVGANFGLNLAHGAGNLKLDLHHWGVDFAVWCSYKYLNAGPGGIAGAFVHQKHLENANLPRFEGWWGSDKKSRFKMGPNFEAISSVEAWQLSNPPIFQLASLRASLDLFDRANISRLRTKGDHLTAWLEWALRRHCRDAIEIVTPPPPERGSMLCVRVKQKALKVLEALKARGAIVDFRHPDILRITPAPIYNNYSDVYRLVQIIKDVFT